MLKLVALVFAFGCSCAAAIVVVNGLIAVSDGNVGSGLAQLVTAPVYAVIAWALWRYAKKPYKARVPGSTCNACGGSGKRTLGGGVGTSNAWTSACVVCGGSGRS